MIDSVAAHILGLPIWVALLVVFALPALESSAFVGFVFPGEIALILGGVLASEGQVSLAAVLAAGIAGAVVGDSVGYVVGRRYGRRLLDGTLGRFVRREHLDRAERYLAERGGKAVFLGRFTAALRVMIPGLAGMSRMHYPRFAVYNVAGGVAWATMSVLLGYVGGSSWQHVAQIASRVGIAALVVLALAVGAGLLTRRAGSDWPRRLWRRLAGSPAAQRLRTRFPQTTGWLARRLDATRPDGLLLTALALAGAGATWLFLGVTQDVVGHEELASIDPGVRSWVLDHRTQWLTSVLLDLTWLGSNAVLLPVLALVGLALRRMRRSWRPLLSIALVYGLALLGRAVVGQLVHRHRPPHAEWLASAHGWSFPSGHTLQAVAGYGLLWVLLAPGTSPRARALWAGAVAVVVLVVGASRVYLGVHWLTDVIGSLALGVALLCLWGVARLTTAAAPPRAPAPPTPAARPEQERHTPVA